MASMAYASPVTTRQTNESKIITASKQMKELFAYAARVAASDAKVLITGESGVGKDVIARHIHAHSPRRSREFVAVNCAGVAESLLESELFGHVKGSFTGAHRDKLGKLQLANGGTLFLDELGEMSPRMQGVLLRFLENGEITPVGSDATSSKVNVRVIAATNRNLPEMVAAGQFREDLLYRVRVIHLHVPSLRDRREDIKPLALHFLNRSGKDVALTEDAWAVLERHRWPGNVRELQNVMEQISSVATEDTVVDVAQLPHVLKSAGQAVLPARERRRQLADELFQAIVDGGYSFWEHVHPMFLERDITRHDVREVVRRGLSVSRGNYRGLLDLFRIPANDYKRFMNFLSTHDCRPDFREFRNPTNVLDRRPQTKFPGLRPTRSTMEQPGPAVPAVRDPEHATI
jgi:transcriptional regulator with PAS, ATPase and Fis domain